MKTENEKKDYWCTFGLQFPSDFKAKISQAPFLLDELTQTVESLSNTGLLRRLAGAPGVRKIPRTRHDQYFSVPFFLIHRTDQELFEQLAGCIKIKLVMLEEKWNLVLLCFEEELAVGEKEEDN